MRICIYSLTDHENAPSAVVCSKANIITASGCALANIPVVDLPNGTTFVFIKARVEG